MPKKKMKLRISEEYTKEKNEMKNIRRVCQREK